MNANDEQFTENWIKLKVPNYYHYKDILGKRTDYKDGTIELIARDFTGKRCKVESQELLNAMNRMEKKLKGNY